MIKDPEKYIDFVLRQYGEVYIPGIGLIRRMITPSRFTMDFERLTPPSLQFQLVEEKGEIKRIINLISISEKVPLPEAEGIYYELAENVKRRLSRGESIKIGRLGSLVQSDDLIFFLKPNPGVKLLRVINTRPVSDPVEKEIIPIPDTIPKSPSRENEWINYLLSMLLGALFIVGYNYVMIPSSRNEVDLPLPQEVIKEEPLSLPDTSTYLVPESVTDTFSSENDTQMLADDQALEYNLDSTVVTIAMADKTTECVIITGVFTNGGFTERMVKRIKDKGYRPYVEQVSGATRVGITFPCEGYDLKKVIEEVRRNFNNRAWYLHPQISI